MALQIRALQMANANSGLKRTTAQLLGNFRKAHGYSGFFTQGLGESTAAPQYTPQTYIPNIHPKHTPKTWLQAPELARLIYLDNHTYLTGNCNPSPWTCPIDLDAISEVQLVSDCTCGTSWSVSNSILCLTRTLSQLNPNLSQLNPNLSQLNPNL